MHDDAVRADRARSPSALQRRDRLLVIASSGAAKLQIEGVTEHAGDLRPAPLAEQAERRRVVIRLPPGARALREHLPTPRRSAPPGRSPCDAAAGRDMRADVHLRPTLRSRFPGALPRLHPRRHGGGGAERRRSCLLVGFHSGDTASTDRLRDIAFFAIINAVSGQHPRAVGVAEQEVVPSEKPHGCGHVGRGRGARRSRLGARAEPPERFERLERRSEVGDAHVGPGCDVGAMPGRTRRVA